MRPGRDRSPWRRGSSRLLGLLDEADDAIVVVDLDDAVQLAELEVADVIDHDRTRLSFPLPPPRRSPRGVVEQVVSRDHEEVVVEVGALLLTKRMFPIAPDFERWAQGKRSARPRRRHAERGRPPRRDRRHPLRRRAGRARGHDLLVVAGDNLFDYSTRRLRALVGEQGRGERGRPLRRRRPRAREEVQQRRARRRTTASSPSSRSRSTPSDARRDRDVPLPPLARPARRAAISRTATRPTSRAASSPGSSRGRPSTATASRANGATSATRSSSSRPTTGSGSGPGYPFAIRTFSTRVPPMATTEPRTDDVRWDLSDLYADADEARARWSDARRRRSKDFASRSPRHDRLARRCRHCARCSTSPTSSLRSSRASRSTPSSASAWTRPTSRRTISRRSAAIAAATSRTT